MLTISTIISPEQRNVVDSYEVLANPIDTRKLEDYFLSLQSSKQYDREASDPKTQKTIWEFYISYG